MDDARRRTLLTLAGACSFLAGCSDRSSSSAGSRIRPSVTSRTDATTGGATNVPSLELSPTPGHRVVGYTTVRASGNRVVAGRGAFPDVSPVDVGLDVSPLWLVTLPLDSGTLWVVVGTEGRTRGFIRRNGTTTTIPVTPERLPRGTPPALTVSGGEASLVTGPQNAATQTHPLLLANGRQVYVDRSGDVVLVDPSGTERARRSLDALPDARLVTAGGLLGVLAGRTRRYDHGVLGDAIEAERCVLLDTELTVRSRIDPAGVIEGVAPILADLTGDSRREVVLTVSDADRGARVVAFDRDGRTIASGAGFDGGYHWRHQLAVAPFGPDGTPELATVETPHVGGTVEFYRRVGEELRVVASLTGYASHTIESRVLDGGVAGDFDGDGRPELLVPDDSRTALGAVERTDDGAREGWRLPVGGTIATNVAATTLADGGLAVGVGHADGVRLWQSTG